MTKTSKGVKKVRYSKGIIIIAVKTTRPISLDDLTKWTLKKTGGKVNVFLATKPNETY